MLMLVSASSARRCHRGSVFAIDHLAARTENDGRALIKRVARPTFHYRYNRETINPRLALPERGKTAKVHDVSGFIWRIPAQSQYA